MTGRCNNTGSCSKAISAELITIAEWRGSVADPICPECHKPLVIVEGPTSTKSGNGKIIAAAAALLIVAAAAFLLPKTVPPPPLQARRPTGTAIPTSPATAPTLAASPTSMQRNVILRLHGSNTIGAELGPELAKAFLHEKGAATVEHVPGERERESFVQGDLNSDGNPEVIEIHAHGSKTAFASLKAGSCDIGMSSMKVPEETARELIPTLGDLSSNASEHTIALDGLAVIVHPANPVTELSAEQVAAVFAREITNWSQVGGSSAPIALYAPDDKSGTFEFFRERILAKDRKVLSPTARRFEDNGELSNAIAADENSIGFVSMAFIRTNKALVLSEKGVQPRRPNTKTVKTEDYFLTRRLYLYTATTPKNPYVTEFTTFATNHTAGGGAHAAVNRASFVNLDVTPVVVAETSASDSADQADDPRQASAEWRELTTGAEELLTRFRFRSGSADLDTRAQRDIGRVVGLLSRSEYEKARLILIGFSDVSGVPTANKALSLERAKVVQKELELEGLQVDTIAGLGGDAPVASNDDPLGREKNRRVEVWVRK
jgi:phosphate transport system substrate-binding protein